MRIIGLISLIFIASCAYPGSGRNRLHGAFCNRPAKDTLFFNKRRPEILCDRYKMWCEPVKTLGCPFKYEAIAVFEWQWFHAPKTEVLIDEPDVRLTVTYYRYQERFHYQGNLPRYEIRPQYNYSEIPIVVEWKDE